MIFLQKTWSYFFDWSSDVFLIPRPYYCVFTTIMLTALWLLVWISNHSSSSVNRQDKNTLFSVNVFIFYAEKKSYNINNSWRFSGSSLLVLQCMTVVQKFNIYIYINKYIYLYWPHKSLGARRVACSSFHIEGPQILGDTIQNFVSRTTWGIGNFSSLMCDIRQTQVWLMLSALLGQTKAYLLFTIAAVYFINVFNSSDNPLLGCEQICSYSYNLMSKWC